MLNEIIAVLAQTMKQYPTNFSDETVIKDIPRFDALQYVMMLSDFQESHNI